MAVTKQVLGRGYVVSVGVVLSLVLVGQAAVSVQHHPLAALLAVGGLVPALALAASNRWLADSGLEGEQIWTVAQ